LNRGSLLNDRVKKKPRKASHCKHLYPTIPTDADDDESLKRNMDKLKEEINKLKPIPEVIKNLLARIFSARRSKILNAEVSVSSVLQEIKVLKKCSYVS